MGMRAGSARPQRVSGSARTDSQRAESARNPIASHVNFGDASALSAFTRTQWTEALTLRWAETRADSDVRYPHDEFHKRHLLPTEWSVCRQSIVLYCIVLLFLVGSNNVGFYRHCVKIH